MSELPIYLKKWKFCPECGNNLSVAKEEDAEHIVCTSCNFHHYANPFPTATVTLFSLDGEHVLLGKRKRDPQAGTWCLPGGFIDWSERTVEAAQRELAEEANVIGTDYKLVGEWEGNYNPALEMKTINMHYMATILPDQTPTPGSDISEVKWVHYKDMPKLAFHNQQLAWEEVCRLKGFSN